jgi:Na+-driven multidrug efflux pump
VPSMSTWLPFRYPRWFITDLFYLSYLGVILSYLSGEMWFLISSIIFFGHGCLSLFTAEHKLSRRASIALVTTGLCLYAPAPYLLLQGYFRFTWFPRDPVIDLALALATIVALTLAFILLLLIYIRYKKSLVTETQRT